jgi:hypothetical protein
MRQRRETVEHPFGTMKARMGATHFLTKTLPKVAAEMALSVPAYNLTRVINIVGIKPLIAADGGLRQPRLLALRTDVLQNRFYTAKTHSGLQAQELLPERQATVSRCRGCEDECNFAFTLSPYRQDTLNGCTRGGSKRGPYSSPMSFDDRSADR